VRRRIKIAKRLTGKLLDLREIQAAEDSHAIGATNNVNYNQAEIAQALRRINERPPTGRLGRSSVAKQFALDHKDIIATMLAAGHSVVEIAREVAPVLKIKHKTVEAHIRAAVGKRAARGARKGVARAAKPAQPQPRVEVVRAQVVPPQTNEGRGHGTLPGEL
jgi:DNA-binding NarL/FixJ family response regulator